MSVGDSIFGFKVYDTADGKDTLYKTVHSAKGAASFGLCAGTINALAISKPVGIPLTLGVLLNYAVPAAAAGAVYATTTNVVGEYRGKSGPLNHAIGGCAAGFIFGAKAGTFKVGVPACLGLAGVASFTKMRKLVEPQYPEDAYQKSYGTIHSHARTWGAAPRSDIKAPTEY